MGGRLLGAPHVRSDSVRESHVTRLLPRGGLVAMHRSIRMQGTILRGARHETNRGGTYSPLRFLNRTVHATVSCQWLKLELLICNCGHETLACFGPSVPA